MTSDIIVDRRQQYYVRKAAYVHTLRNMLGEHHAKTWQMGRDWQGRTFKQAFAVFHEGRARKENPLVRMIPQGQA